MWPPPFNARNERSTYQTTTFHDLLLLVHEYSQRQFRNELSQNSPSQKMFLSTLRRQASRRYLLKTATRRPFAFRFVSTAQQQPPLTDILPKDMAELESFTPKEPTKISTDMASGILDTTDFYCRHGISKQRFDQLAAAPQLPIIYKWQKMMEIYMTTQL